MGRAIGIFSNLSENCLISFGILVENGMVDVVDGVKTASICESWIRLRSDVEFELGSAPSSS